MLKKNFYFICLLFALEIFNTSNAQEPQLLWYKLYGIDSIDVGYDISELSDGGFMVVGFTKKFSTSNFDVWLLRTNSNGDTLWTKKYGGAGDDYGYSLKQTEDGGFIIGGATNSFGSGELDFYLIRVDSLGDTLWTKTFGDINNDIGWSVENSGDGGFILAGETNAYPQTPDAMIVKVDSQGQIVWSNVIGTFNPEYIYSIKKTYDNSFILAGYLYVGSSMGGFNGWLLKIDSFGDSLWSYNFGGNQTDKFYSVDETTDHGYILTGSTINSPGAYSDVWILKTDSIGVQVFSNTFDFDNDIDVGYSIQQTEDGGYIISGSGSYQDVNEDFWLLKADSMGNLVWSKHITYFYPNLKILSGDTIAYSVKQTDDGGYIITGSSSANTPPVTFNNQLLIVRIEPDIIPVELTTFSTSANHNAVTLNWQTATETNNSGFEIERSLIPTPFSKGEGTFETIAFVPGFGTTTEPKSYSFVDDNLSSGKYQYRLKQIDFDGTFEYSNTVEVEIILPTEFSLEQNYPNPFNPTTKIKYTVPNVVTLKVYDVLGNEVATLVNEEKPAGTYEVEFNVGQTISLSSGVYYYQLKVGGQVLTRKMILMK